MISSEKNEILYSKWVFSWLLCTFTLEIRIWSSFEKSSINDSIFTLGFLFNKSSVSINVSSLINLVNANFLLSLIKSNWIALMIAEMSFAIDLSLLSTSPLSYLISICISFFSNDWTFVVSLSLKIYLGLISKPKLFSTSKANNLFLNFFHWCF